jgi:MFS family permease
VGGYAYVAEAVPHGRQDLAHSIAFTAAGVGWASGSALGGFVAERFGFGSVFVLGLAIGTAAIGLSLCLSPLGRRVPPAATVPQAVLISYKSGYDLLQANRTVRVVALVTILATLGWHTFGASFYLDYLHRLAIPLGTIGLIRALSSAARVLAPVFYYLFSSRIGVLSAILWGVLLGALGLAVTPLLTSVAALAIVGTLTQTANYFYLPGVFTMLHKGTGSSERATSIAVQSTSWAFTAFIAGPAWALVVRRAGLSSTFFIAGLVIMVGTVVLVLNNRRL